MTKTLEFENDILVSLGNFLGGLELYSKASRGRSTLVNKMSLKNEEFQKDAEEIRKEYFKVDEDGRFLTEKNSQGQDIYVFKDPTKESDYRQEMSELGNEKAVLNFTEYSEKLKSLYKALEDYPKPFTNSDAAAYNVIMDEFDTKLTAKDGNE